MAIAMATLCNFVTFYSFSSRKLFLSCPLPLSLNYHIKIHHHQNTDFASSFKKASSRTANNVKRNENDDNGVSQFLSSVGLQNSIQESVSLSLGEKVARFIEHGELDMIEDFSFGGDSCEDLCEDLNASENIEYEAEVKRLKSILHQKEIELTMLKQQIENEKVVLSILEANAETEMSKTLLASAKESLPGLKELADRFGGLDQEIKLDLKSSWLGPET